MTTMIKTINFETHDRHDWVDLTSEVKAFVAECDVAEGLCLVYNPHSTGGLFVNSFWDPNTPNDIMHEIDRLVPTRFDFLHQNDTPTDAAGHVKSALMGIEATFIIHEGALMVGHSQGIVFAEFDGPRPRKLFVKVIPD
jgi:secondary thiamine-phosphate synthase enzyme